MVGFFVLRITGERLELSRLVGITRLARRLSVAAAGVVGAGLAISALAEAIGVRAAGVGLADGRAYDATLYAIFLGFVISMIFAHAPVVVPARRSRPLPHSPLFYVLLLLLYLLFALWLVGHDAASSVDTWQWVGSLNEISLLLFAGLAAHAVIHARHQEAVPAAAHPPTRVPTTSDTSEEHA